MEKWDDCRDQRIKCLARGILVPVMQIWNQSEAKI